MEKKILSIILGLFLVSGGACFADQVYYVPSQTYQPTLLDKIEDSTQDFAQTVGEKTTVAADKTGKAIKKGAKATGHAVVRGAKKAGHATKKGAKKATNWSATKIRDGADKVIIKTEDTPAVVEPAVETAE